MKRLQKGNCKRNGGRRNGVLELRKSISRLDFAA